GPRAVLAAPLAWVAVEMMRSRTALHFPWCLLGYSQVDDPAVIQVARFTAVYGVAALVCAVSAAFAYAALGSDAHRRRLAGWSTAAIVLLAWGYGMWRLRQPDPVTGTLRVGLVQASVLQDDKWAPDKAWENIDRHVALTHQAAAEGAQLVVWP